MQERTCFCLTTLSPISDRPAKPTLNVVPTEEGNSQDLKPRMDAKGNQFYL